MRQGQQNKEEERDLVLVESRLFHIVKEFLKYLSEEENIDKVD